MLPQIGRTVLWGCLSAADEHGVVHVQDTCRVNQLNIGHKVFAGFEALDGVFVDLKAVQLEKVGRGP